MRFRSAQRNLEDERGWINGGARHNERHRAAARTQAEHHGADRPTSETPPVPVEPLVEALAAPAAPPALSEREQRFQEVIRLHGQGWNYSRIARELQLNIRTVKRYVLSRELPKRGAPTIQLVSTVTPYLAYLERRWHEGCQNKTELWQEIQAQGYQGSRSSVYRALKRFQPEQAQRISTRAAREKHYALSPRQGMWLLVR